MTYARRYCLAAIVMVCPEDDDGNAASGKREVPQAYEPPPPPPDEPTVKCTDEQTNTIYDLVSQMQIDSAKIDAFLDKYGVKTVPELNESQAQEMIKKLLSKKMKLAKEAKKSEVNNA
jgi:hypothetical protein